MLTHGDDWSHGRCYPPDLFGIQVLELGRGGPTGVSTPPCAGVTPHVHVLLVARSHGVPWGCGLRRGTCAGARVRGALGTYARLSIPHAVADTLAGVAV